jgi:hypothetical protein
MKQHLVGIGALLAYLFIFVALSLGDAIRERRLQKQLGKNYEGPAAE